MDVKKATTLASVTVMTFMLSGGFFITVCYHIISYQQFKIDFFSMYEE